MYKKGSNPPPARPKPTPPPPPPKALITSCCCNNADRLSLSIDTVVALMKKLGFTAAAGRKLIEFCMAEPVGYESTGSMDVSAKCALLANNKLVLDDAEKLSLCIEVIGDLLQQIEFDDGVSQLNTSCAELMVKRFPIIQSDDLEQS